MERDIGMMTSLDILTSSRNAVERRLNAGFLRIMKACVESTRGEVAKISFTSML